MTQYLFALHHESEFSSTPPPSEVLEQIAKEIDVFNEELKQGGHWVFAGGLHPPETATVVRDKDGATITTDGPYLETKEQLGGFWIIQAEDMDTALALAARATVACRLPVEVRPFQDEPEA